jgi:uncharacterized membrane protein YqaE (UPF0057 family)
MIANNIWKIIGDYTEKVLLQPYEVLRHSGDWWTSNIVNIILFAMGVIMGLWWMAQMFKYKRTGKEDEA